MKMKNKINFEITKDALNRVKEISAKEANQGKFLRISVLGGGCSGFQYNFNLDDKIVQDDSKIEDNSNIVVVIDKVSMDFLDGCKLDFVDNLGGNYFKIENPKATANCGCGNSFAI